MRRVTARLERDDFVGFRREEQVLVLLVPRLHLLLVAAHHAVPRQAPLLDLGVLHLRRSEAGGASCQGPHPRAHGVCWKSSFSEGEGSEGEWDPAPARLEEEGPLPRLLVELLRHPEPGSADLHRLLDVLWGWVRHVACGRVSGLCD